MNGKGAAIAKVVGQVVVALLGLLGAALGVWSQGKASDVGAVVKATVERLDARVTPAMQRAQDESRVDVKTVVETVAGLRERLARLKVEISRRGSCRRPSRFLGWRTLVRRRRRTTPCSTTGATSGYSLAGRP